MALTDKLTAIADQVRRISKTEDAMTLDQMATNLLNVVPGGGLPSAEESSFGVAADTETGITSLSGGGESTIGNLKSYGWKFTAAEAFSIVGFRQKHSNTYEKQMKLWDSSGKLVASITTSDSATDWISYYLDTPINVAIGETYTVSVYTKYPSWTLESDTTFNSKLGSISTHMSSGNVIPAGGAFQTVYNIDIIISSVTAELPDSYEIKRATMDDIAEELQRISGTTGKMNTAQIITALQGLNITLQSKTVTPTDTAQEVTPDSGYYGLSSVTVEAIPATESEATE